MFIDCYDVVDFMVYISIIQLYERRISQAKGKEVHVMRQINEKLMSDEETDCEEPNSFTKRSPPWRSDKLNNLFRTLDGRYELKQPTLKKNRKVGPFTDRLRPQGVPTWALCPPTPATTSPERACSDSGTSPTSLSSSCPVLTPSSTSCTPTSRHISRSSSAGCTPTARHNSRSSSSVSTPTDWGERTNAMPWRPGMTLPSIQGQSFHMTTAEQDSLSEGSESDSEMDAWIHAVTRVNCA